MTDHCGSGLSVIARFHARIGQSVQLAHAISCVEAPTRRETGCVRFEAFQCAADENLYFIHSKWRTASAFDHHAELPHTISFLAQIDDLVDRPPEIIRVVELVPEGLPVMQ